MSTDAFQARRAALEEQFFKAHEDEVIAKMKERAQERIVRDEIHSLTGINNEQVLDALAGLKISGGASVLVMSLFPMIEVAWADGKPDARETKVLLDIAATMGIVQGTAAHAYLSRWLEEKPEPAWHTLWAEYTHALVALMKPADKAMLKSSVLDRARVVAEASGGFLGVAWRVSEAEKAVLTRLEKAFA
jgi:tellurite resistance protein